MNTPRTDTFYREHGINEWTGHDYSWVAFARDLERELAAARADLEASRAMLDGFFKMRQRNEELVALLRDMRVLVQGSMDTMHELAIIGNLMAVRDLIDRALEGRDGHAEVS